MNAARYIGTAILLAAVAVMLWGCKATMTTVSVPVPVECKETEPTRPIMPTDAMLPGADIDKVTQAAIAVALASPRKP